MSDNAEKLQSLAEQVTTQSIMKVALEERMRAIEIASIESRQKLIVAQEKEAQ